MLSSCWENDIKVLRCLTYHSVAIPLRANSRICSRMNDTRSYSRLFNPNSTAPNQILENGTYKHGSDIVVRNKDAGIYNLISLDSTSAQSTIADEKSIVISIHGAQHKNERVGYGVWFAEDSVSWWYCSIGIH